MPADEDVAMSAGTPCKCSNAQLQLRAPAPPVSIRVPSMSNKTAFVLDIPGDVILADRKPRRFALLG
jgi:hypothetical protein